VTPTPQKSSPPPSPLSPPSDTCANCARLIPPLERGRTYDGQPVCAACLQKLALPLGHPDRPIVTERTAKRFKRQILLATLLILAGLALIIGNFALNLATLRLNGNLMTLGLGALIIGVIWLAIARLAAWWHHG
jgi:hypothetical protein